jgi:hypothetical protein
MPQMKEALAELALMNWTLAALTLTLKPQQLGAISNDIPENDYTRLYPSSSPSPD